MSNFLIKYVLHFLLYFLCLGRTGHGDDLGYIFEPNEISSGAPIKNYKSGFNEEDKLVRDFFTDLITDFAHKGEVNLKGSRSLPSFSENDNSFLSIKPQPEILNNFR